MRVGLFKKYQRLNLALQGGGAHGAFTWGVLDRLLQEPCLVPGWLSATSAGAVNAVAMASGLANGDREEARAKLTDVWEAICKAAVPDLMQLNPFLRGMSSSSSMQKMASMFSPYEFNPLGFDPLRELLGKHIDFDAIRANAAIELLIAATDIATGRARLFRRQELSVDVILASACLPQVHHTVVIDGKGYWDGGFTANPDLVNLALQSPFRDTLIVQIESARLTRVPTGTKAISHHSFNITFQQPLIRDVEFINAARQMHGNWFGLGRGRYGSFAKHRFHLITAGRHTSALPPDSKMKPDWKMLTFLRDAGRQETEEWLARHAHKVGHFESVDLRRRFLE